MTQKTTILGALAGSLAALMLVLALWPSAARPAAAGSPLQFGDDGVTLIVVPAADFVSDGFDPDSSYFLFTGGYFRGTGAAYGCMEAPVYVPSGSHVFHMFASVYDNDPARGISITLRRVDNFSGVGTLLGSVSTSAGNVFNGIQILSDSIENNRFVVHPDHNHYLTVCLGSDNIRLYSVRLRLISDTFLPSMPR